MNDQLSQDLASLKIDRSSREKRWYESPPRLALVIAIVAGIVAVVWLVVVPKVRSSFMTPDVKTGDIALVSPAQAQVQLTATGYVIALVSAKVAARVPGRIAELFVEEGKPIEKGQRVARLEDVDFKSGIAASRARASSARAKIAIARANLGEVKLQIQREQPLVEKGVSAKATLDDLVARADSLTAQVRAAEAEAVAADAETKALEIQLGSYEIVTPISGIVVKKLVEVGEGVSPGFGTPGVVEVVDMNSLVVEVDVPEVRISQVGLTKPCEIVLDAFPQKRLRGIVKEIGQRVNRQKATIPVRVSFVDKPLAEGGRSLVLPDMAARVSFLNEALDAKAVDAPPVLVVPASAVVQRNGGDVIFIVDDGEVRMTAVKVGAPFGTDMRELQSQIPSGTKVVLEPSASLADGQKVKDKK